jgi:hypothetical protein
VHTRFFLSVVVLALGAGLAANADAQPSTPEGPAAKSPASRADSARVELSGTIFANYQYGGSRAERSSNRFELERAYLTVRAPLGDRASARVTADVFQQRDPARNAYYGGWTFRAKYAYLQYDWLRGGPMGLTSTVRGGILHTVVVEHEETFWPRWINQVALERAGFFSSSDAGVAASFTLPGKAGELYATITNGPGYQSRETDRFKDYAARLTLTPLAGGGGWLETLAISPWIYRGARASSFAAGVGSLAPVVESRERDRWGIFAGVREPRLTVGAHWARRTDDFESIAVDPIPTPDDSTIVVESRRGTSASVFAIARPFALDENAILRPLGLLARVDEIEDPELRGDRRTVIAGVLWTLTSKWSLALDYQEQAVRDVPTSASPSTVGALDTRTWFLHAVANF